MRLNALFAIVVLVGISAGTGLPASLVAAAPGPPVGCEVNPNGFAEYAHCDHTESDSITCPSSAPSACAWYLTLEVRGTGLLRAEFYSGILPQCGNDGIDICGPAELGCYYSCNAASCEGINGCSTIEVIAVPPGSGAGWNCSSRITTVGLYTNAGFVDHLSCWLD